MLPCFDTGPALSIRHFAEHAACFYVLIFRVFNGLPMASRLHSSLVSVIKQGERHPGDRTKRRVHGREPAPMYSNTKRTKSMPSQFRIHLAIAAAMTLAVPVCLFGQSENPELKSAIIVGTAVDINGGPVPNATVALKNLDGSDPRTLTTGERGSFEFRDVQPGVPYQITITAQDFADWNSPSLTVEPGQFKIVTGIQLRVQTQVATVNV